MEEGDSFRKPISSWVLDLGLLLWLATIIVTFIGTAVNVQSGVWSAWGYLLPATIILVPLAIAIAFITFVFYDSLEEGEATQHAAPAAGSHEAK